MSDAFKWSQRQRLQYIEFCAFYLGSVTRRRLAEYFTLSDAAATKDLQFYQRLFPNNLRYDHRLRCFLPTDSFSACVADLSPAMALQQIEHQTLVESPPEAILTEERKPGNWAIATTTLSLPLRLPAADHLAQLTRAIYTKSKAEVCYHSLSDSDSNTTRIIEPHTLVNTGNRWHVRAYNEYSFDFRDFVLGRFTTITCLYQQANSQAQHDEDWTEQTQLHFAPHPRLSAQQKAALLLNYQCSDNGEIEIITRRALIGYLLQRLAVDTTPDQRLSAQHYPLILLNLEEIRTYAAWALEEQRDPAVAGMG